MVCVCQETGTKDKMFHETLEAMLPMGIDSSNELESKEQGSFTGSVSDVSVAVCASFPFYIPVFFFFCFLQQNQFISV